MIQFKKIIDIELLDELNKKENVKASQGYYVHGDEAVNEYVLYNINDDYANFVALKYSDDLIAEGLVRSAFSNLFDININKATFGEYIDLNLIKRIGFLKNDAVIVEDIKSILFNCTSCKSCNKCC